MKKYHKTCVFDMKLFQDEKNDFFIIEYAERHFQHSPWKDMEVVYWIYPI